MSQEQRAEEATRDRAASGWPTRRLRKISAFISKGSTPTTYGFKWERAGVLFLRSECVSDRGLDLTQSMFISEQAHATLRRSEATDGDILITITGNVGRVVRLKGVNRANMNQHIARIRVTAADAEPEFVFQVLAQPAMRAYFASITTGQAYPQISLVQVRDAEVPFPPLEEQRAVSKALGDVDALLAKLDQLIAKKRDLKQVAMQQLLTGRTRLPGFSDPWREQAIGELAEIVSGATPRTGVREYWDGGIPWCTPTDITASTAKFLNETDRTLTAAGLAACSARLLPAGALLLCTRATVGEVKIAAMSVCTNQGFKSLVCRSGLHNEYLYYQLLTMKPRMLAKASGSTFPELSRAETAALQLPVPSLDEQRAIARVLADIDDDLVALEARREKTRQLKQGMMQALLTGRIRLVPAPAGDAHSGC